jgi:predicted small lipoprotein YifL
MDVRNPALFPTSINGESVKNHKQLFLSLLAFLFLLLGTAAFGQQLPQEKPPADVSGDWTIYSKGDDGQTATQYITLKQDGNTITGHFKGPHQSGSLKGTINIRHIVFQTNTREVLTFRGMVDGNTMEGNFGIRGHHGTWQARRPD